MGQAPPPPPGGPPPYQGPPPGYQGQPGGYQQPPQGWQQPNPYAPKTDPQGRPLAEWWKRLIAYIVDALILAIPSWLLGAAFIFTASDGLQNGFRIQLDPVTGNPTNVEGSFDFFGPFIGYWALMAVAGVAYYVLFHGSARGQTPGKMIMKIAVRDETTGGPIGYGRSFVRYLVTMVLWFLCTIPGIVDHLFPLWDDKKQTLHDKAARSLVVEV